MMKLVRGSGLVVAGFGLALIGGATSSAFAAATPSGNMNLRLGGYAVITPSSGSSAQVDIDGIGQVVADATGAFSGALTYTAVSATLASEDVCTGTVAGTITAPSGAFASGSGEFTIGLTYTPSSSSTGTDCIPSTATLLCNRALAHVNLVDDLDAGEYQCVATSVTAGTGATAAVNAASLKGSLDVSRGANAPTS